MVGSGPRRQNKIRNNTNLIRYFNFNVVIYSNNASNVSTQTDFSPNRIAEGPARQSACTEKAAQGWRSALRG